ncbi:MAG: hypothetical protein E7253_01870 [Lachnospiraceae bacterium]|nr:hypothetical protein [Lachnospiraceae bacterium]
MWRKGIDKERHCQNAKKVAKYLASHPKVEKIKQSNLRKKRNYHKNSRLYYQ